MVYTEHEKEIDKRFRERNKERLKEKHRLWWNSLTEEQKQAKKERDRQWRLANREKINERSKQYNKEWRKNNPERAKELYKKNHKKYRDKEKEYNSNNKDKSRIRVQRFRDKWGTAYLQGIIKKSQLKKLYNLSIQDYFILLDKQDLKCAICGKDIYPHHRDTHVDHDHVTGKVRGLLCSQCNPALGNLEPYLDKAKEYVLRESPVMMFE